MSPSSYFSNMTRSSRTHYEVKQWEWPITQLLVWRFIMYGTSGTLVGIFASFIQIQSQMGLDIPWIFPYGVTVGALTIVFLLFGEAALLKSHLIPAYVMLYSFVAFILYLTGLIGTAIQLFGSSSDVNGACNAAISNDPAYGVNVDTLAWLEQRSICQSWDAVFAFWVVGFVLFVWLFILAVIVNRTEKTHET